MAAGDLSGPVAWQKYQALFPHKDRKTHWHVVSVTVTLRRFIRNTANVHRTPCAHARKPGVEYDKPIRNLPIPCEHSPLAAAPFPAPDQWTLMFPSVGGSN